MFTFFMCRISLSLTVAHQKTNPEVWYSWTCFSFHFSLMTPFSFFLLNARWPFSFTLHFAATGKTFIIIRSSHVWYLDNRFQVFCCRLCTSSMNSIHSSIIALSWVTFLQTCWNKPTQPVWLHLLVWVSSHVSVHPRLLSAKQQHKKSVVLV